MQLKEVGFMKKDNQKIFMRCNVFCAHSTLCAQRCGGGN